MKSASFLIRFFLMLVMLPVLAAQEGSLSQDELRQSLKERHKKALRLNSTLTTPENRAIAARKMRPLWRLIVASQSPESPKILKDSQVARADSLLQELQALKEQDTQWERRIAQQQLRSQWAAEDICAEEEKQTEEMEAQRRRDETERIMQEIEEEQKADIEEAEKKEEEEEEEKVHQGTRVSANPQLSREEIDLITKKLSKQDPWNIVSDLLYTTWANAQEDDVQVYHLKGVGEITRIEHLAISPNNKYIAAIVGFSDYNASIFIWDVASRSLINRFDGRGKINWFHALDFSPNSQYVVAGSWDNKVRVWHVEKKWLRRALKYTLSGHPESVMSVAFSPDGTLIASGSLDGKICLWDAKNGTLVRTLICHDGNVSAVKFSPDSTLLASGSYGQTNLWDVKSGGLVYTFKNNHEAGAGVTFSSDGTWIASGSYDNGIRLWNVKTGTLDRTFKDAFRLVAMSADTRSIFSRQFASILGGRACTFLDIWDRETGIKLNTIGVGSHGSKIVMGDAIDSKDLDDQSLWRAVALSKNNEYLVFGGVGFLMLCRLKYMRPVNTEPLAQRKPSTIAPAPPRNLNKELFDLLFEIADVERQVRSLEEEENTQIELFSANIEQIIAEQPLSDTETTPEELKALYSKLAAAKQERSNLFAQTRQLVADGANPFAVVPGWHTSIVQRAAQLLGKENIATIYLLYKPWLDDILRLAKYLYEESMLNPTQYTQAQQQDLKNVVTLLENMSKKSVITPQDVSDAQLEMYHARHIYLSAPTRANRIVTIPALPALSTQEQEQEEKKENIST